MPSPIITPEWLDFISPYEHIEDVFEVGIFILVDNIFKASDLIDVPGTEVAFVMQYHGHSGMTNRIAVRDGRYCYLNRDPYSGSYSGDYAFVASGIVKLLGEMDRIKVEEAIRIHLETLEKEEQQ